MIATFSGPRGTGQLAGTFLVAKRVLLKFARTPQLVIGSLAQMALFLTCFRYVFGGAISASGGVTPHSVASRSPTRRPSR